MKNRFLAKTRLGKRESYLNKTILASSYQKFTILPQVATVGTIFETRVGSPDFLSERIIYYHLLKNKCNNQNYLTFSV